MIDVIIATYNRPKIINSIVADIQNRHLHSVNHIIVVDSTDEENSTLKKQKGVIYIHSSHKNQPYQRYLGYNLADSDNVLFLDDDMQILDDGVFSQVDDILNNKDICGINLAFKNFNTFLLKQHSHRYGATNNKTIQYLVRVFQTLSGRPTLKAGKMWYCGLRGKRVNGQYAEFFFGGAFAAKRNVLYNNFNFDIFSLYEKRIGKGEDAVLAYTLSKQGKIYNLPGEYLFHNDPGNSTYTSNNKSFQYRVAFSRMYMSKEYARLNKKPLFTAILTTFWYNLWRSVGLFCSSIKTGGFTGFIGYVNGSLTSAKLLFQKNENNYWLSEIKSDLNANASF